MTETLTALKGGHVPDPAPINVSQQIGASIGTALLNSIAIAVTASFITAHAAGAAPSRVVARAAVHRRTQPSVIEIATDGAPACVELRGAS